MILYVIYNLLESWQIRFIYIQFPNSKFLFLRRFRKKFYNSCNIISILNYNGEIMYLYV